ncbi:MAG: S-layer homology domain-containing protein [Clostridiales bacterium]|jgi:hypothetical protein|nr:S-layer homology domain-containing protein [Clostridiales bacterium]
MRKKVSIDKVYCGFAYIKKTSAFILSLLMLADTLYAQVDETIYKDPVVDTYYGRSDGQELIDNLNFRDLGNHWAKESIIQAGALNLVKGYDNNFNPNGIVTNQEALAYVVRALGMERMAQDAAIGMEALAPEGAGLLTEWSTGYLEVARQIGLITDQQFAEATAAGQEPLGPEAGFSRTAQAKREDVADFIYRGLSIINPGSFNVSNTVQSILAFSDYQEISVDRVEAVEAVVSHNIMAGGNSNFNPQGAITRAEMAQVLRNLDSVYFKTLGILRLNGAVAGIKDVQASQSGAYNLNRDIYLRMADGSVSIIQFQMQQSSSPQAAYMDTVVYKGGSVVGLGSLKEGDTVEFLVESATNRVLYANVGKPATDTYFTGKMTAIDIDAGQVTMVADNNKIYIFNLSKGLLDTQGDVKYIFLGQKKVDISTLPLGSKFQLTLWNNIARELKLIGQDTIIYEGRGIVTENNHSFGYISYIDNSGAEKTMYYNSGDMKVEKQNYYDMGGDIGYYDEVFPDFRYDPLDSEISEIEPGDIVFIRPSKENPETIESISAAVNYIMKTGKVLKYTDNIDYYSMLVEYDDKQTVWFDLAKDIFVSGDGQIKSTGDIVVGDYVKILVNQAIIQPGYVIESAKEVVIEGNEHFITTIIKGQLAGVNAIQNKLQIQNPQELTQTGWANYSQLNQLNLLDKNAEYYYNGERVSVDYALKYLKRSPGEVYIALENNYTGEKVKKVTFRGGRDSLLPKDTIVAVNADGSFKVLSTNDFIKTDNGTIVVKEGRLVTAGDISSGDFASIAVNDGLQAAVVDITKIAENIKSMFVRARVNSVDEGNSFRVQSIAVLDEMEWSYSPINRDFAIDYNTLFINGGGFVSLEEFMDYTENSVVDKVFNVIVDGSKATHIIDSPYAQAGVRGEIYEVNGNELKIKDATYYDNGTGKWQPISRKDNTATVTIPANSAIAKNSQIIFAKDLQKGNQIKIMTDSLPENIDNSLNVTGYIILVEK